MNYSWRDGFRGGRVPADVAAAELARIEREYGGLRPVDVEKESRPADAKLHPEFEWDDAKAGYQFRLDQARRLVRAVVQTTEDQPPQRVYTYVPSEDESLYRRTEVAASREDLRVSALIHLRHQVSEAEQALMEFKAACEVHGADEVLMARLLVAAETAAALRSAVDALH